MKRHQRQRIHATDLFCGAGGTSTGLAIAARELAREVDLIAINHWGPAVETHKANHPWARHLCETLDSVDPRKIVERGRLHVLAASPECTSHSIALGGKPINDQSRATAWHVLRWCEALRVDSVVVENVAEFQWWGPIGTNGRPLKSRKGETFKAWLDALVSLGFDVQYRVLNAADYGDATTRRRLFILANRRRGGVRWPEPSHAKDPAGDMFRGRAKWRAAREIIDWTLHGRSIFGRKKPLSPKTIARIEHGLRRFGGKAAEPFLVLLRGGGCRGAGGVREIHGPLPTVSAGGTHHALVQPFVVPQRGDGVRSVDDPAPTLTTTSRGVGVVEPFMAAIENAPALCEPILVPYYGTGVADSVHDPLATVTTKDRWCLVTPAGDRYAIDIRLRMLQPHELAAAMGFPSDYQFVGTKTDAVKMIGNAVCVNLARALFRAQLGGVA